MSDVSGNPPDDDDGGQSFRMYMAATPLIIEGAEKGLGTAFAEPPAADRKATPGTSTTGTASADGGSAGGQCCGAYPADVLTAALGTPVDPKELWGDVGSEFQKEIARSLTQDAARARFELLQKSAWATAPEMVLLDELGAAERPGLAREILEVRTGTTEADYDRRSAEADLARQRVALAEVLKGTFEEANNQMKTWTKLARLGKVMLVLATLFSAAGIAAAIVLAGRGELGEVETPIIIFALAVFAISPAVLLLRERPLEGLDKWTPSGLVGGEEKSEGEGESSGSGTSPAATTSS